MAPPKEPQTMYVKNLLISPTTQRANPEINRIKSILNLQPHPEGGYFAETDRDALKIPNPFQDTATYPNATVKNSDSKNGIDTTRSRNASTTIHYYLDQASPHGVFHRNKGRTVHSLHHGHGVYVLIHADETTSPSQKARVETFTVGPNIAAGERLQWIVEGGKFKASFLLPDSGKEESEQGLLISETVVPGFEFMDHDFLTELDLKTLVGEEDFKALRWLLKEAREEESRRDDHD